MWFPLGTLLALSVVQVTDGYGMNDPFMNQDRSMGYSGGGFNDGYSPVPMAGGGYPRPFGDEQFGGGAFGRSDDFSRYLGDYRNGRNGQYDRNGNYQSGTQTPYINRRQSYQSNEDRNGYGDIPLGNRMGMGMNTFPSSSARDDAYDFRQSRENYRNDQRYETNGSVPLGNRMQQPGTNSFDSFAPPASSNSYRDENPGNGATGFGTFNTNGGGIRSPSSSSSSNDGFYNSRRPQDNYRGGNPQDNYGGNGPPREMPLGNQMMMQQGMGYGGYGGYGPPPFGGPPFEGGFRGPQEMYRNERFGGYEIDMPLGNRMMQQGMMQQGMMQQGGGFNSYSPGGGLRFPPPRQPNRFFDNGQPQSQGAYRYGNDQMPLGNRMLQGGRGGRFTSNSGFDANANPNDASIRSNDSIRTSDSKRPTRSNDSYNSGAFPSFGYNPEKKGAYNRNSFTGSRRDQREYATPFFGNRNTRNMDQNPSYIQNQAGYTSSYGNGKTDLTVVLDLDECLIHSEFLNGGSGSQYASQVAGASSSPGNFGNSFGVTLTDGEQVRVYERPFLREFLRQVAQKYEVHLFTASNQVYAKPIVRELDPDGTIFTNCWYRDSCVYDQSKDEYVKDLTRVLGSDKLRRTVLIDNNPSSFLPNPDNGVLVSAYQGGDRDNELQRVLGLLKELERAEDVRTVLQSRSGTNGYRPPTTTSASTTNTRTPSSSDNYFDPSASKAYG